MDWSDLRVFEAVCRTGAISRAAVELNTVQSNVTGRIRALEQRLGVALFDRSSRGVTPTAAGKRLLPYALRIGSLLAEAGRAARDDGTPQGALTIGAMDTTAAIRLPPVMARFAAAYPDVDLTLRTGNSAVSIALVLDRTLEGAFVAGPVDHAELTEDVIFRETVAIVTAPSVASLEAAGRAGGLKMLMPHVGCAYRRRLEAILLNRGIVGVRCLDFGTIDAIIGCVAAGIGISLLPQSVIAAAVRAGKVRAHALPPAEAAVDTLFVRRRDAHPSSALTAFLACARDAAADTAAPGAPGLAAVAAE